MTTTQQTVFSKDVANKKMTVVREFAAPLKRVWAAWTEKELLDKWWAPKPWRAETKFMDFKEGGYWLYCMVGPNSDRMWARLDYKSILLHENFTAQDSFCDENGNKNSDFQNMSWKNMFQTSATGTKVIVEITFNSEADIEKIIEMGFKEGFAAAHTNLDELLAE